MEKEITTAENTESFVTFMPQWDESVEADRRVLLQQQPHTDDLKLSIGEGMSLNSQEMFDQIWEANEQRAADVFYDMNNFAPGQHDIDHDYNHVQQLQMDRDYTGMESDARMRMIQNEFELIATEQIGKKQIEDGQIKMYKGTLKKWQVLDDDAHDPEQIVKLQAAVQAPLPEELEMYKEKHDVPMQLPFNNDNVRAWREDAKADESADFDPEFLIVDRERRKKFFIERFESQLQLKE